jgi:hypothetical protein
MAWRGSGQRVAEQANQPGKENDDQRGTNPPPRMCRRLWVQGGKPGPRANLRRISRLHRHNLAVFVIITVAPKLKWVSCCLRHYGDVRSGSFRADDFAGDEQQFAAIRRHSARRTEVKIYWIRIHVDHMPELTVHATIVPTRSVTRTVDQDRAADLHCSDH